MTISAVFLAALISQADPAPNMTAEERTIIEHVDRNNAQALSLLERIVNTNSGTQNFKGVREVGRILRAEFDALGFKTQWIDGAPFKRAGHLVAEYPGSGPKFLLIGHLDTVFEPDSPFQRTVKVDERHMKGPGIIDMKGGDVIMIQALKALDGAGLLKGMDITVVMTGDEEDSGEPLSAARKALIDAAQGVDYAIGFEDGPADPKLAVTARRGTTGWEVRVTAKAAHSSQVFRDDIGFGAIYEAARIINAFREKMAGETLLTFNPGTILGGTAVEFDGVQARGTAFGKTNVVAEHAVIAGDLRTISRAQLDKAMTTMQEIVKASLPHTQATIRFDEGYPPMAPSDGNAKLLAVYNQASIDLGLGPVTAVSPDRAGAADISFVANHVKMALDGVGLMGSSDHTVNETADLATLPSQTKRVALMLYRLRGK